MKMAQVHAEFVEKGGQSMGRYYQKEKIERSESAYVRSAVEGGFCGGVCMDWIRRVLLSHKTTYTGDKSYREERAALAQLHLSTAKTAEFNATMKAGFDERKVPFEESTNLLGPHALRLMDLIGAGRATDEDAEKLNRIMSVINTNTTGINQITEAFQRWASNPLMSRYWKTFAKEMNHVMEYDRDKRHKGPSRRGFDKLRVMITIDDRIFHDGVLGLMNEVTGALGTNQAAHLGIYAPEGEGHGIALFRQNTSTTTFFDPNFGTYEFRTLAKLKDAVSWLFSTGYPSLDVVETRDAHIYEVNGEVRGQYMVFAGPLG
jgi:hypothetical protein